MDRSAIRHTIEAAFAGVERDPEVSLHQAQLLDQTLTRQIPPGEWEDAGLLDLESDWSAVSGESLDECDAALSHLTPMSWRFYLPAYMCRSMDLFAPPKHGTDLLASVIFHLTYRKEADGGINTYLQERYETLSSSQAVAVREFLEFIEHESLRLIETTNKYWHVYGDAKKALEGYWGEK